MRRLFAFLLALVMILSMSVTAFAEGEPETPAAGTGTITITNATKGTVYTVYKIFDAYYEDATGETAKGVNYKLDKATDEKVFTALFGADGTTPNAFFTYIATSKEVKKIETVNDSELVDYLTKIVQEKGLVAAATKTAEDETVVFSGLPYGYYVIVSGLGSAVTINSNTPDASVIDKNQKPGTDFIKQVKAADGTWSEANTANIGDVVDYKVSFTATNYNGAHQVHYYQVHDEKGSGLWTDFEDITVVVTDADNEVHTLTKGYYLNMAGEAGKNWGALGSWPEGTTASADAADWLLVHQGVNQFRITIPWMNGHHLTTGDDGNYKLTFDTTISKFPSPAKVEVYYKAAVEADAVVGTSGSNLFNKARLAWVCSHESHGTDFKEVATYTYGIGLLKDDAATFENLKGAKFRLYSDSTLQQPVYLVPTNIDGVYTVDNLNRDGEDIVGVTQMPRALYASELSAYLNGQTQDNYTISQENGKLVILGLAAGTYYLSEVEPPNGYNSLTAAVPVEVGPNNAEVFKIYANAAGEVSDRQEAGDGYIEHSYMVADVTVHNSRGKELPSTGGEGTMMLIGIGTFLTMAFAVLMITRKKMSIYED